MPSISTPPPIPFRGSYVTFCLPAVLSPEVAPASGLGAARVGPEVAAHGGRDAEAPLHKLVGREEAPRKHKSVKAKKLP